LTREEKLEQLKTSSRIFVGRLSRNITKDHVLEIFSTYGVIKNVEMPYDTNHPVFNKGFAYVEFEKTEEAEKACKYMDGGQIGNFLVRFTKLPIFFYKIYSN
jgi:RNA recognition motif-containing protein